MAMQFDLKDEYFYKKGVLDSKKEIIQQLIQLGEFSDEKIALIVDMPASFIETVKFDIKQAS